MVIVSQKYSHVFYREELNCQHGVGHIAVGGRAAAGRASVKSVQCFPDNQVGPFFPQL
jgi:hypothetical protein